MIKKLPFLPKWLMYHREMNQNFPNPSHSLRCLENKSTSIPSHVTNMSFDSFISCMGSMESILIRTEIRN